MELHADSSPNFPAPITAQLLYQAPIMELPAEALKLLYPKTPIMELPADSSPGFPAPITARLLYPKHQSWNSLLTARQASLHQSQLSFYIPSTSHGSAFMSPAQVRAQLLYSTMSRIQDTLFNINKNHRN